MKKRCIIFLVLMVILLVASCGPRLPEITDEQKTQAAQVMEDEPGVTGATINQKGRKLSLSITVESDTSEIRARLLAEKFITMMMYYGPESHLKWEEGIFDYLVTIVDPNEQIIMQGEKTSEADHITW